MEVNLIPVWTCIPLSRKSFLSLLFLAAEGYSFTLFFDFSSLVDM